MLALREPADIEDVEERAELRQQVARTLEQRLDAVVNDSLAVFPFAGMDGVDATSASRLADLAFQLIVRAVRDGEIASRSGLVADVSQLASDRAVAVRPLFGLVYLLERAALDELALDESYGATSEPWPAVAQLVRRSSFEVVAALADRFAREPAQGVLHDSLTTLHTRAVLLAVLDKEIHRAERLGRSFALILFDVDRLGTINEMHGYGFGDRVLERIGIVVRNYFREQDWVCRCAEDGFAVLLPEAAREPAEQLAERVRATVRERLALRDYRTDEQVQVTVSAAVLFVQGVDASVRAEQILREAEQALQRAKEGGRDRVELAAFHLARPADAVRGDRSRMVAGGTDLV